MRRRPHGPLLHLLLALLLALLVAPAPTASADDARDAALERRPAWLDLSGAQVFASPGLPAAWARHVATPGALQAPRWPLPAEGGVVILGLPQTDAVAADLGVALGLYTLGEDLGGGYRIAAWDDRERPFVVVLAADPIALLAARFEFIADASAEQLDPMMREVDVRLPDAQARTLVRRGCRDERPLRAWRAWRPDPALLSGHAERARSTGILFARLAAHRVSRVVVPLLHFGQAVDRLAHSGVAVVPAVQPRPATLDAVRADLAQQAAPGGGLDEVLVDLGGFGDRPQAALRALDLPFVHHLVVQAASPTAARVVATWRRRHPGALSILVPAQPCADAWCDVAEVARQGGCGVVLDQAWVAPTLGGGAPRLVPTPPPQLAAGLTGAMGVLVAGDLDDAGPLLEGAWTDAAPRDDQADVIAALPAGTRLAADPRAEVVGRLTPLATTLRPRVRGLLEALGMEASFTTVPIVPAGAVVDGQLGEPAWGSAVRLPQAAGAWVVSDGRALLVGLRLPADAGRVVVPLDDAGTRIEIDTATERVQVVSAQRTRLAAAGVHLPEVTASLHRCAEGAWTAEVALDRMTLGFDAHAGQVIGPFTAADGTRSALLIAR